MRALRHILIAALLAAVFAAQASDGGSISLVEPGSYHGNELRNGLDGNWLGLVRQGSSFSWQTLAVRVVKERDEIVDEEIGTETGKRLEVVSGEDAVLLLRGMPALLGTVVKPVLADDLPLNANDKIPLDLSGSHYTLTVSGSADSPKEIGKGSSLVVSDGKTQQVLYALRDGGDDPSWSVLWAGDMDGDGRLDVYVNVTDHYNVTNHTLFLSSLAKAGELVHRVAVVTRTGC